MTSTESRLLRFFLLPLWAFGIIVGFCCLADYDTKPALADAAPLVWPPESSVQRSESQWTILMFVHPRCPCSRASLNELSRIVGECPGQAIVHVLLFQPPGTSGNWNSSSLRDLVDSIPQASITIDSSAGEAKRFSARVSGQTYAFDSQGRMRFSGGITGGRGHYGPNSSSDRLIKILLGKGATEQLSPVYGCDLRTPCAASAGETL
jgi:hypothetical protein